MRVLKNEYKEWVDDQSKRMNETETLFRRMIIESEKNLQQLVPKGGSSKLHNSIPGFTEVNYKRTHEKILGRIGSLLDYSMIAAEFGRKPGKMPPSEALKRWARLKLGNEQLAFPIAKKIGERGTKKYREKGPKQVTRAFKVMEIKIDKMITKILDLY